MPADGIRSREAKDEAWRRFSEERSRVLSSVDTQRARNLYELRSPRISASAGRKVMTEGATLCRPPNKRIEFAPFGRPTRKQRGCLLAAHPRRSASNGGQQ